VKGLLFLIILFVIAVVLRIDFFFTIFYLFFLVYALSHIWMQSTARRLTIRRRFDNHAFSGDEVNVELVVRNEGWLPFPWLEAHESLPVQLATPPFHRQVFSLGPHAERSLHYELHCRQRGYYWIGPMAVRAGDLLGLVRPRLERADPAYLVVYPRVLSLEQLGLPTRSPLAVLPARSPLFEDPARVMGVREYQRGDSPRRIHWTASAKATSAAPTSSAGATPMHLMVKRYQPAIARETLICLDLYQQDYGRRQRHTASELAIVVAASLANHIIVREGLPVGLLTEAWDPVARGLSTVGPTEKEGDRLPPGDGSRPNDPTHVGLFGELPGRMWSTGLRPFSDMASGWGPTERLPSTLVRFSLPPRSGRGHLMQVLEVLARAQAVPGGSSASGGKGASGGGSGGRTPFVELLRQGGANLSWGSTIAIVTGRESEELLDTLFHLRRAGFAVSLILVQSGFGLSGPRSRSEHLGVPVYRVWEESDLESMRSFEPLSGTHQTVVGVPSSRMRR
jgi:uncharacterized protein (DUF58 family)